VAVNPLNGNVYVSNFVSSTVSVFDPTGALIDTISVTGNPQGLAVSPTGTNAGNLYVALWTGGYSFNPGTVAEYDSTDNLIRTIGVGNGPTGLAIAP